ncbi:MAG: 2-C-methyl-D-erythritol 4-phosphate cytidylyltransferase [Deltaproteobacteria bacterium]|nr:2-C-methyl-D-erythritol 4-phosphate cytidylyltransferase [Deltaproteobacteria bacterium]
MKVTAVIVAAGEGLRVGGNVPKPYLPLVGRAMLLRTLDRFFAARSIEQVVLVVAAGELSRCEAMLRADSVLGRRHWVLQSGGATRQQSVKAGLEKVDGDTDIVVIHDGARPFVSPALIERCIELADRNGAVVVGLPARDTIKIVSDDHRVLSTPDRKAIWEIQTPQAFRRELIVKAHDRAVREGFTATDDAMLVEQMGKPVWVIDGEKTNMKITMPEDLWLAEAMIREGRIP